MRILISQLNPTVGDLLGNSEKIIETLTRARREGIDVVLFSELVLCGYPPEDLLLHQEFIEAQQQYLEKILPYTKGLMAVVGMVRHSPYGGEKFLCNSAAVLQEGVIAGFVDKRLLPTYDVFDERRYFEPGNETRIWEYKGERIGILICEDIWQHASEVGFSNYTCDPVLEMAHLKPTVLFNLSSSPYHYHKVELRLKVCAKTAQTLQAPLLFCCQVGGNDQLIFDGYSLHLDGQGRLCQIAKGFQEDSVIVDTRHSYPEIKLKNDPLQDLYQALVLGVRDYFHKLGFKKGCLGLSGGIDSALVACIAVDALGKENVRGVAMPSRYSSSGSLSDAKLLATHLGIPCDELSIESPFTAYLELLSPLFKGKQSDLTEENMQARIRGMILMAISNKFGEVVLSTGNKSELALGYCTLYGDMCGGLSVIADVTKGQVYLLAQWLNRNKEIIPLSIIEKPPSAELKPNQKDSDTLPDYAIIDQVLEGYIEDLLSTEQIAKKYDLPLSLVEDLIHRIHLAEYKRRQSAPGIRVSRKAFRVGRSYPIVQKWR